MHNCCNFVVVLENVTKNLILWYMVFIAIRNTIWTIMRQCFGLSSNLDLVIGKIVFIFALDSEICTLIPTLTLILYLSELYIYINCRLSLTGYLAYPKILFQGNLHMVISLLYSKKYCNVQSTNGEVPY